MGMGLIFPSLPGRDEVLRQVIPYWIGVAANGLPGNSAGIKDRTRNRHWWTGRVYRGA
jgi:hypothetical protein